MIATLSGIISDPLAWYRSVKESGKLPFWIVFGLTIYLPFEEFIIKWIPGSPAVPALARFIPESILYLLCLTVFWHKISCRQKLKSTPIDLLVIIFFLSNIVSIIINGSNVLTSVFFTLRTLWRYLSVYYIVVNIDISLEELSLILNSIKVVGLIQGVLASIQYFLPESIKQIFAPKDFEFAGYKKESYAAQGTVKAGSTFGTFDDPAILSSFLIVAVIIFLVGAYTNFNNLIPNLQDLPKILIIFFGIFASKKRAALLLALIIPIVIMFCQGRKKDTLASIWLYATLGFITIVLVSFALPNVDTSFTDIQARKESVSLSAYFLQILSPEYWEESNQNSRGFLVKTIISTIISSHSWFGFGPDLEIARQNIASAISNPGDIKRIADIGPFEDVYWFAMLAYFGVVGLIIYFLILLRLYQVSKWLIKFSSNKVYKNLGVMFCTLIIVLVIYCFIERVLKFRPFSFYFWLLAGLVINAYYAQKSQ